jgi:type I restriction enzyme S subunit
MTENHWPIVHLAEVLTERRETPDPTKILSGQVPIVSKIGFDTGRIELRNSSQTRTGMILIQPGDLVLSGINAAKGAIAIYDKDNTTPVAATIHYGAYTPNDRKVDLRYLWHFLRSRAFQEILTRHIPGGIKTELKATRFLAAPVPLPALSEQRRIVAKIEDLFTRIDQVRNLASRVRSESESLCRTLLADDRHGMHKRTPMAQLVTLREPDVIVVPSETYRFAGVYCFGRGVFSGGVKTSMEFSYKRLTRIRAGDFVYPKLMAWEGALAVVPPECEGLCVSPEFPVFDVNRDRVLPETLDVHFRTPSVWAALAELSTGTNVRRRRLHPNSFLGYQFPLPPMRTQLLIKRVKTKVDQLKVLQAKTSTELDALLPSILDKAFKGEL